MLVCKFNRKRKYFEKKTDNKLLVYIIYVWGTEDIIHVELLKENETITAGVYFQQFRRLAEAIHENF